MYEELKPTLVVGLPYLLSLITSWQMWLAGNNWRYAWLMSLGNQVFWFIWIYISGSYGFIILSTIITLIAARNHFKWMKNKQTP